MTFGFNLLILFLFVSSSWTAAQTTSLDPQYLTSPVQAKQGMVVTAEELATKAGLEVLKKGGNAVDAAATIGFVLAVTLPRAGNIGGGGFMLIYLAKTGEVVAIDYREKAPGQAHRDMFLDKEGEVDSKLSTSSHLSVGVPGTVAGFALALEKYGTLTLAEALAPAIKLAEEGFTVTPGLNQDFRSSEEQFRLFPASMEVFFKPDGRLYETGDLWIQKDLAKTLKVIARDGAEAFYEGEIAELIAKEMMAHGGLLTQSDLASYRPVLRKPVHGTYRGYDIYSMPPPSSGGTHLVQILNILEGYDIKSSGFNTAATLHLMVEAMKRAYADRSEYLGDSDFINIPLEGLTSKAYATALRNQIDPSKATPAKDIKPGRPPGYESSETTHYSVIDQAGNTVSNTYTLNFSFGSGIVVQGAGFLLNNEMDDFSAKPGVPNAYGLVGGTANAIEPHKRMLSSMSPTIVLKEGKPFLITGSPGGPRIITTTLQVILNVIDHGMNIQEAVNALRVHHQWLPDNLFVEEGLSPDVLQVLTGMGYQVSVEEPMGAANSIQVDTEKGIYYGAADPREGGLALGY